jgi:hypothetical protein
MREVNWKVLLANPAPFVFTHLANHMRTASFFLDLNPAVSACPNFVRVWLCPFLIPLVYLLLAAFTWMPLIETFEAISLLA